jgi:hypothetical protein
VNVAVIRLLNAAKMLLAMTTPSYPVPLEGQRMARNELQQAIADVEALVNPKT